MGVAFLGILVLIMVLIALISVTWYSERIDVGFYSVSSDYGLYKLKINAGLVTFEGDYDDVKAELGLTVSQVIQKAEMTRSILIIGILATLLFVILAILRALDKIGDSGHTAAMAMGFISSIILLVTIIYFATAFPNAIEEDGGSKDVGDLGGSWWIVLFAFLLNLIAAEITRRAPTNYEKMYPDPYGYGY